MTTVVASRRRRRNRPASLRYLNVAAAPDRLGAAGGGRATFTTPGQLLEAVGELAGGREAICWVHEAATLAWGLPARLPPDHAAVVSGMLGVGCRAIGSTGWLVTDTSPPVHLAFPAYSGDFAGLGSAVELLQAVEAFRTSVGLAYVISGPKTVHTLIAATCGQLGESTIEPELAGYQPTAWATPSNWWGLVDLELLEAAGRRWVLAFDRAGSYLSAWQGAYLPAGEWTTIGAGELEPGPESQRPAGYWLIDPAELPDVEGSFDPWRRHGDSPGPRWLTTPLAQLAVDLAEHPVPFLAAVTAGGRVRWLDTAAGRLRDARALLAGADGPSAAAALTTLKGAYAGGTAWFEFGPTPPDPLARPGWRRTIIDRYAANTWRALERVTPGPFAVGEIDTALFALDDPDQQPDGLRVGDALGLWKTKGRPVPIGEARAALDAGGHRALLQLITGGR